MKNPFFVTCCTFSTYLFSAAFFVVTLSVVTLSVATFSPPALAQILKSDLRLTELSWIDRKYFDKQRQVIDNLGRENYGTRVRGNQSDLALMQRIIDGELINKTDHSEQIALGVVLGDVYVAERGLVWREYTDEAGKSRAVCMPDTEHCLFPLSMITRRMKVTEDIDITRIYERGIALLTDVTPSLPYEYREEVPKPKEDHVKYHRVIPYVQ